MGALHRLTLLVFLVLFAVGAPAGAAAAEPEARRAEQALTAWYRLSLALVRHTPTYSPPVASRTLAYMGVASFESVASGDENMQSLAGQLNGLRPLPERNAGGTYDGAVVINAALSSVVRDLFQNTGPTGQRVIALQDAKLHKLVAEGLPRDVVARSEDYGRQIATHVLSWSRDDGGAVVENMGFPYEYELAAGPARWVPTSLISQQQLPLLPKWGANRTFAMPTGKSCGLAAPPEYSEDKASPFYAEALEVYQTGKTLSPEQRAVARFWSDDPMLSPTPPGHWISIALQIIDQDKPDLAKSVDVLARLGIVLADAFIGCWETKFHYDLLRPVTYIHRMIDPKWETLLITPPFPEYPSGHSTQSAAAAAVLTDIFGEDFAFEDRTREGDGLKPRRFASFWAAADEAAISRLLGGIHFRSAIERGLQQGRCIGEYTNALRTRR
ncbi:vanadium-dependent haloperoxidase [Taklimakanibacter lacteus]|uniref:vanadium-dependent haloperoxidase n=1 Tax=Taklimakanibacter lacteus TaxID=2268456 RepID=UPI000E66C2A0